MAQDDNPAAKLARALRDLRVSTWPGFDLTQAQLATVLSVEGRVASATVSSWESTTTPKTPPIARINAYARFFCTPRSQQPTPHLIPEEDLEPGELIQFRELESRLLKLLTPDEHNVGHTFQFETGPVIVICPTAPPEERGPLADEQNPNFNRLQQYGDLDALIELYGHLRAENPNLDVFHRLTGDVVADDLSSHVVLLGGVGWNIVTRRFQNALGQVPITQVAVEDVSEGDIFTVDNPDGEPEAFYPEYEDFAEGRELVADVGFIARVRNPFKSNRTLTICNGVFSGGVFGAVRCLTDASVREENERYLAERFPEGEFAMLIKVPILAGEILSPDLQNPDTRRFEWSPSRGTRR